MIVGFWGGFEKGEIHIVIFTPQVRPMVKVFYDPSLFIVSSMTNGEEEENVTKKKREEATLVIYRVKLQRKKQEIKEI